MRIKSNDHKMEFGCALKSILPYKHPVLPTSARARGVYVSHVSLDCKPMHARINAVVMIISAATLYVFV